MNKNAKRLLILIILVVLALAGWIAAGPYLAIRGIQRAMEARDVSGLERHVDYPTLRSNLRAHLEDRIAREIGRRYGAQVGGGMMGGVAGMLSDSAVDAMVSPAGIAILLQGHALKQRATGNVDPNGGVTAAPIPYDPMKDARTRFESPSRFVATVNSAEGKPIDFIFERQGLRWRLTDVGLPQDLQPQKL